MGKEKVRRRLYGVLFALLVLAAGPAGAALEDLRITEVDPTNGLVEVTHTGTGTFTIAVSRPFCHRFFYSDNIPAGTVFTGGQARVFSLTFLDPNDSDLWLYRQSPFFDAGNILTGLKYGPAANVGRTALAATVGLWPSGSAFVPAPATGETLQAISLDTTQPSNWISRASTLSNYFGTGLAVTNPAPDIPRGTARIGLLPIATNRVVAPLGVIDPADSSGRLFIYDQAGFVWIWQTGAVHATPLLTVTGRLVSLGFFGPGSFDERGLLGLALHPDFAANGKLYTYTSEPTNGPADFTVPLPPGEGFNHQSVVAEWRIDSNNLNQVDVGSRRELLRVDEPQFNHNAGQLAFGPDGYLYISLGDGGGADDQDDANFLGEILIGHGPNGNGQTPTNVLGALLRIDVDGHDAANGQYGIPTNNPFLAGGALPEIFAYGFRNPYRFSFDAKSGDLYIADVGQNDLEEIDIGQAGGNYGWRLKEGTFAFDRNGLNDGFPTTLPVAPLPPGLIDPVAEYDHDDGLSIIGGFVYRGRLLPELDGLYLFGDFANFAVPASRLFYMDAARDLFEFTLGADDRALDLWIKGFGQDRQGEVYLCGSTQLGPFAGPGGPEGKVYKLIPLAGITALTARDAETRLSAVADTSVTDPRLEATLDPTDGASWAEKPAAMQEPRPGLLDFTVTAPAAPLELYRVRQAP